jgi:hypothetical protein
MLNDLVFGSKWLKSNAAGCALYPHFAQPSDVLRLSTSTFKLRLHLVRRQLNEQVFLCDLPSITFPQISQQSDSIT